MCLAYFLPTNTIAITMGVEGNLGALNVFGDWLPRTASSQKTAEALYQL